MICSSSQARSRSACTTSSSCTLLNSRGLQSRLNWSTGSWWRGARADAGKNFCALKSTKWLRKCGRFREKIALHALRPALCSCRSVELQRSQFLTNGLVIGRPTPAKGLPYDFTFSWSLMNCFFLTDRCPLPDQMSFLSACSRRTLVLAHRDRNRANKN